MQMLEISGLTKRYGPHVVLDGVEAELASNAVHFVMGPNGAGKTTLLRCLLGLVPHTGDIRWRGRPIDPSERLVFPVFDEPPFYPRLTGRQNLAVLAPEALGQPSPYVDERLLRQRFGRYSRGQGMRLALTAALHSGAELIVLDEPANGLDRETMSTLRRDLRAMRADCTFVLTGHQLELYDDLVDTVTLLRDGTLRRVDDPAEGRGSLADIYDAHRPADAG
jgi:ABC-2 type transport system ATP-binding protein